MRTWGPRVTDSRTPARSRIFPSGRDDRLADFHEEAGAIHLLAVHTDMPVRHQLARGGNGRSESKTEDGVVEATLEKREQVVAGFAGKALRLREIAAKLRLGHPVVEANLLLLLEEAAEHAGLAALRARRAVLAGRIRTALAILASKTGELNAQASNDPETGTANRHEGA